MVIDHQPGYAQCMAATSAPAAAERVPAGALLARLGQEATARFRRALQPLDLGAQEFIVLKQLQTMGLPSQAELADAVGMDYSNCATLAAGLCSRSLIDRRRDAADRRRYVLELSRPGQRLVRQADAAIAAVEDELLTPLGGDEREQLDRLLRMVADGAQLCPPAAEACG
jgi:DNA-binding MarR family transcriptional regulator